MSWLIKPLVAASALALSTLGLVSRKSQKAKFYLNLGLYSGTLGIISLWGVVVSILASAVGQRFDINYIVARSFYYTCGPLIGWRMKVEGGEHLDRLLTARDGKSQSAVLLGNHQSFVDILFLGRIFPRRASIMAKQELKWIPLLGQYMSASGAVWVNRKDRKDAMKAMQQAGDDMKKNGISLWIFPEGTRSLAADPVLLPFKKGAFHLAVQAQIPIIPVVCENYYHLFDRSTRMDSGVLTIKVLPPISTIGLTSSDVDALVESTRSAMVTALESISRPGPSHQHDIQVTPEDLQTPKAELPRQLGHPIGGQEEEKTRRRNQPQEPSPDDSSVKAPTPTNELRTVDSRGGESTEDEMDDDAVLLKHPKHQ